MRPASGESWASPPSLSSCQDLKAGTGSGEKAQTQKEGGVNASWCIFVYDISIMLVWIQIFLNLRTTVLHMKSTLCNTAAAKQQVFSSVSCCPYTTFSALTVCANMLSWGKG